VLDWIGICSLKYFCESDPSGLGSENVEAWRKYPGLRNKIDLTFVKGHLEHGSINVTSCYNCVFCLRLSLITLWMGDSKEKHPKEQPVLPCRAPLLF